jgi:hypothetical protein
MDHSLVLNISGNIGERISIPLYLLTPVGKELMTIIQFTSRVEDIRRIANAMRPHGIKAAEIRIFVGGDDETIRSRPFEVLWKDESLVTVPINEPSP